MRKVLEMNIHWGLEESMEKEPWVSWLSTRTTSEVFSRPKIAISKALFQIYTELEGETKEWTAIASLYKSEEALNNCQPMYVGICTQAGVTEMHEMEQA